jgi:mRNA interferase RelE/StbE
MEYEVILVKKVKKQLDAVPKNVYRNIRSRIDNLAYNPRPDGCLKMKGVKGFYYRIRVGDYRVIYTIEDNILTIEVIKIGHRKDIYNDF